MKIGNEIKRKIIQIAAFGYSNPFLTNFAGGRLYKGQWKQFCNPGMNCYSCPAASLACPVGAMQAVNGSAKFSISFYVTGILLAIGLISGRAVCGFLCPFGLIQELLHRIPSPKFHLPKQVTYLKYALLVIFVLVLPAAAANAAGVGDPAFCKYICPAGTLEGGIPMLISHPELRRLIGGVFGLKAVILAVTIVGCVLICRFFCKAMCPLGAVYGLCNKVSLYRVNINKDNCIGCGVCSRECPMDVDPVHFPDSAECIRCGKCADVCPANALSLGFRIREREGDGQWHTT